MGTWEILIKRYDVIILIKFTSPHTFNWFSKWNIKKQNGKVSKKVKRPNGKKMKKPGEKK